MHYFLGCGIFRKWGLFGRCRSLGVGFEEYTDPWFCPLCSGSWPAWWEATMEGGTLVSVAFLLHFIPFLLLWWNTKEKETSGRVYSALGFQRVILYGGGGGHRKPVAGMVAWAASWALIYKTQTRSGEREHWECCKALKPQSPAQVMNSVQDIGTS